MSEDFNIIKEFKILEEVVNQDHEERLKKIEGNLCDWSITGIKESFGDDIEELQNILGTGEHWPDIPKMSVLQLFVHHSIREPTKEWYEAFNEVMDAWGFVSKSYVEKLEEDLNNRIHKLSEDWAIDLLRDEVGKWWKAEMNTIKAKLEKILEHIGDQRITKTLREEVEAIDSEEEKK